MVIDHAAPLGCLLGEGPLWHPAEGRLYGVDIEARAIWRLTPGQADIQRFQVEVRPGCLGIRSMGGFVLAGERAFFGWDVEKPGLISLSAMELGHGRFNDGSVDAGGRFWAGMMTPSGSTNSLFCIDADHRVRTMEKGIGIANGIGWSPDQSTMYFTDSPRKLIYAYDFDEGTGNIENRRPWVDSGEDSGVPDGLCVDLEGCVWSARWDGWRISRYDPSGQLMHEITLPVQRPTSCAFGGADLQTIFITSARTGLTKSEFDQQPLAGDLLSIETGISGQPPNLFLG